MRILGHGIDIVEIDRIEHMIDRHGQRFLDRCFTAAEQGYAGRMRRMVEHYAGRFAAKEAVLKALGTGWRDGIAWTDIEIARAASGRPSVVLTGVCRETQDRLGILEWSVSISHIRSLATASAIGVGG